MHTNRLGTCCSVPIRTLAEATIRQRGDRRCRRRRISQLVAFGLLGGLRALFELTQRIGLQDHDRRSFLHARGDLVDPFEVSVAILGAALGVQHYWFKKQRLLPNGTGS